MKTICRTKKFRKGQTMLEVVMVLPFFVLILAIMVQFGIIQHIKQRAHMAVRYGARAKAFKKPSYSGNINKTIETRFWKIPKGDILKKSVKKDNLLIFGGIGAPPGGKVTINYEKHMMFKFDRFKTILEGTGRFSGNRLKIEEIEFKM